MYYIIGRQDSDHKIACVFLNISFSLRTECCAGTEKKEKEEQTAVPDKFLQQTLRQSHDTPIAVHPGHDKTLFAIRKKYNWPTLCKDIEIYIAQCFVYSQHKSMTKGLVPMLQCPLPDAPWDLVLYSFLKANMGLDICWYVSIFFFFFSRYVMLAPLKNKSTKGPCNASLPSSVPGKTQYRPILDTTCMAACQKAIFVNTLTDPRV